MKLRHNWTNNVLALTTLLCTVFCVQSEALEFSTGTKQTQLIELFTSEGCSSCPPADRWLSRLKSSPELWGKFVPVAYHVDYWDYIGWKDRFAVPAHGARQRQHAAVGNVKTVYTPGFVVDGMEWRGWFQGQRLPSPSAKNPGKLIARLNDKSLELEFLPRENFKQLVATIALLGAGHVSIVSRGENADRTLEHDFAVLNEHSITLARSEGKFTASIDLPRHQDAKAVAIWISSGANLRPIQATGGWLNGAH